MTVETNNPCLSCGACCASFRVSFYWAEAEPAAGGWVPPELTEKFNDVRAVMKGTNRPNPRCVALEGVIGRQVACSIYAQRPSPCREFPIAFDDPDPDAACDRVRERWGLPRLKPRPEEVMP